MNWFVLIIVVISTVYFIHFQFFTELTDYFIHCCFTVWSFVDGNRGSGGGLAGGEAETKRICVIIFIALYY